jgi:hypothetical protein
MAGKGFDAKAFLVNHTEKLVLGAAGLMVAGFLASAQWKPYSGTPQEITEKVAKGERELANHDWPKEEREQFNLTQANLPKQIVHEQLLRPILVSQYEMSTRFVTTPWQGKEPLREPSLLTLEDALADAGKVLIERPVDPEAAKESPEETPKEGGTPNEAPMPQTPAEDDEFATGRSVAGTAAGFPGGPLAAGETPGAIDSGTSGVLPGANAGYVPPGAPGGGDSAAMMQMYAGYGGGGDMAASSAMNRNAQGYYFASVRAVFPLKEQIRRFQDATNSKTFDMAALNFEVIDFNLERQEQVDKAGTWSDWQPVDIQAAVDVLDESMPPEPDVVKGTVTNNVMTMPLPPRIYGLWNKVASHPRIEKFELNEEQFQMEIEYQSKVLEQLQETKKETDNKPRREKGGFSSRVGDTRAMQSELFGGSAYGSMMMGGPGPGSAGYGSASAYPGGGAMGSPASAMMSGQSRPTRAAPAGKRQENPLEKLLATVDNDERGRALREYIKDRVQADGELLLFRYIDFAVEPGKTYRYRVRLVLNNPNYGRLPSEANGEAQVVEGETRTTEWCDPTKPVTIERDVYYFVKDVDAKKGKTRVSVYQWDTKLGTTVSADLDLYPGQHVAGVAKTRVIDPAKNTNEEKEYTFKSSDVFVDARPDIALDRTLHKDLKIPPGSTNEALLPEELLVVDSNTGELSVIDPVRLASEQTRLMDAKARQDKNFEVAKAAPADAAGGYDMYSGVYGEDSGTTGAGRSAGRGGRKARNPLAGGMMGGYGGASSYPGGGAKGTPPGGARRSSRPPTKAP